MPESTPIPEIQAREDWALAGTAKVKARKAAKAAAGIVCRMIGLQCLGDVSGKGMPAALLMATVRATLRAVARQNPPAAALELARQALETDFERTGSFVTLFHAQLNVGTRRLCYVDAGHSHVFVCRANGTVEDLERGGRPLGISSQQGYQEGAVTFCAGDALVVYSDGLLEAWSDREPLVLTDQCRGATSAAQLVERLVGFAALAGSPPDDLTVVVLRCNDER